MLDDALKLAERDYAVFPCAPRGKIPLTSHGCLDATTDEAQIRRWWSQWPEANVAVATGEVSRGGLLVVDLDGRQGMRAWVELARRHGRLPLTLIAETGGGGAHLVFAGKGPNSAGKLGPGIDTRGTGGYIVAPPSVHPSGRPYRWLTDREPVRVSSWLSEALLARPEPRPPLAMPVYRNGNGNGKALLLGLMRAVLDAPEGQRNNCLNWAAYHGGQHVDAGRIDGFDLLQMLETAGTARGLTVNEVHRTVLSGLKAGRGA